MNNNAMTAVIRYGICRSLIVQDSEGNGAAQHKITGGLSMAYFGFYTQEHMAEVAAVLREMGYCISAFSQMSLIWNGR